MLRISSRPQVPILSISHTGRAANCSKMLMFCNALQPGHSPGTTR